MNCEQIQELFSARWDDHLRAGEQHVVVNHLSGCADCAAEWETFAAAMQALNERGSEPTSPALQRSLLAAVDDDVARRALRRRIVPIAGLAALAGAAAAVLVVWLVPGARPVREVERIVEVPVERRIEVPVQVPVEVIREVSVTAPLDLVALSGSVERAARAFERGVDRAVEELRRSPPAPEIREVPVPTGPLLSVDTGPLADALIAAAGSLRPVLAAALTADLPARTNAARPAPAATAAAELREPRHTERGYVNVQRRGPSVVVEPHGPVTEYVPILLAQLSYAEPAVRTAIEDQLTILHERANTDPRTRDRGLEPPPPGRESVARARDIFRYGQRDPEVVDRSPQQRWSAWWQANREILRELDRRTAP